VIYYVFDDVINAPNYYYNSVSAVNAYSWVQNKVLHIVFRGTEGYDDVKIDLMELQEPLFPGNKKVLVHRGFLKQLRSIFGELLDTIDKSMVSVHTVQFSGHSLGAALATLAAGIFSPIIRSKSGIVKCHTIGCPRIGNAAFVDWFSGLVDESYRFLNFKDPVPLLPVNGYYKHINGGYEIDSNCNVIILKNDKPWWIRLLVLPFTIYWRAPIANHACQLYIDRLSKLADWDVNGTLQIG
jgi:predicted lipase